MPLHIIGTSHIAKESIKKVIEHLETLRVDILALELDKERLQALLSEKKEQRGITLREMRTIGFKGYLFAKLAHWAEHSLGGNIGVTPGAEMKEAFLNARKKNITIALVDQDVRITLKNISKSFTWNERWNILVDIGTAILASIGLVKIKKTTKLVLSDLSKVPGEELIEELLRETRQRYPSLYDVLVTQRNKVIARKLAALQHEHPSASILAVLGAAHKKEVETLYKKYLTSDYVRRRI